MGRLDSRCCMRWRRMPWHPRAHQPPIPSLAEAYRIKKQLAASGGAAPAPADAGKLGDGGKAAEGASDGCSHSHGGGHKPSPFDVSHEAGHHVHHEVRLLLLLLGGLLPAQPTCLPICPQNPRLRWHSSCRRAQGQHANTQQLCLCAACPSFPLARLSPDRCTTCRR